jgi:ATP-dependent Clp protease ATP-binding subunit ClpA
LSHKRIALTILPEVHGWLAEKGYNPQYGARPLRRTIQDRILTPIASLMVEQGVMEGGTVTVSIKNDEPQFEVRKKASKTTRSKAPTTV